MIDYTTVEKSWKNRNPIQMDSALAQLVASENVSTIKVAIDTLEIYFTNVLRNPTSDRFRSINTNNKAFQQRILGVPGAIDILMEAGFRQQGDQMTMARVDIPLLVSIIDKLKLSRSAITGVLVPAPAVNTDAKPPKPAATATQPTAAATTTTSTPAAPRTARNPQLRCPAYLTSRRKRCRQRGGRRRGRHACWCLFRNILNILATGKRKVFR